MSGKAVAIGLVAFAAIFGAALYWFQVYAFYERQSGIGALVVAGETVPVARYEGIDAASSPLVCGKENPADALCAALRERGLHVRRGRRV